VNRLRGRSPRGGATRHGRARVPLLAGAAAVAIALPLLAHAAGLLRSLEGSTVDRRFQIRGSEGASREVVVVEVDDDTFNELNLQWPFPRSLHAQVIDRLKAAGASVIAYDIQFTEPTEPAEDGALIDAVERAGNVVLATTEVAPGGETKVLGGGALLNEIGARVGNSAQLPDPGGTIRRMPYSLQSLTNFGIVTAEVATRRSISPGALGGRTAPIAYRGPSGTIESVSFSRVVRGQFDARRMRGRIAVVGSSAPTLQDVHPTPTSGRGLMSGPEVVANQIDTTLRGFPLRDAPGWLNVALVVLLGLCAPVASLRLRPMPALAVALGAGALLLVGTQLAFGAGVVTWFVYPAIALALGTILTLVIQYALEALERQRMRTMFGRFVPDQVVDDVLARTDEDLRLHGQLVTGTVLFSDIRGFTTYSEQTPPDEVIDVLNVYLTAMSDAIMDSGGTLVGYIGDGIIAVFGAPIEQQDHADRALQAARVMAEERLESFNEWLRGNGYGDGFRIGVGLHSGPFMAGNVGSERRLEYTIIGDTVNTASRIEGMTKGTGRAVFVSDTTRSMLTRQAPDLELVGEREVRGREQPIKVWALT
jgi:adenylate cyclase